METEMFNTLVGPLLFAMTVGTWGFFQRPEKRSALLHAMILMFSVAAVVHSFFPSSSLFQLLVVKGFVVTVLYALFLRQTVTAKVSPQ